MKKYFLYALAAAATMTACTNEDNGNGGPMQGASGQPVNFGVSAKKEGFVPLLAKGIGTVGDVEGENNVWHNDTVTVYMLNKGTLDKTVVYSYAGIGGELDEQTAEFYDTPVITPDGVAQGTAVRADMRNCYYPLAGSSDFWGYHLDGANKIKKEDGTVETTKAEKNGEELGIKFEIDGTQDIMVAKTLEKEDAEYNPGVESKYLYSAYAARKGVQPNLVFKHKLARLTFTATTEHKQYSQDADLIAVDDVRADNGDRQTAKNECKNVEGINCVNKGVYIDSVKVKSMYKGTLYFAYSDAANYNNTGRGYQRVIWDTDQNGKYVTKYLSLMQKEINAKGEKVMVPLNCVQPKMGEEVQVGDAILLPPQDVQEQFELEVYMHQYVREYSDEYYEKHPEKTQYYMIKRMAYPQPGRTFSINLADYLKSRAFQAGTTYNINLGVSGLEMVCLGTTLTPWQTAVDKDGKEIVINKNLE